MFDFDPIPDDDNKNAVDDFFLFDDAPEVNAQQIEDEQSGSDSNNEIFNESASQKRTSADFEPDMEMILITAHHP